MDELSSPVTRGKAKDVESRCGVLPERVMKASRPRSPWFSGSFYLVVGVVIGALVIIIAARVPWYAVPMIVLPILMLSAVIGALQLRHDERLTEQTFLRLMARSMRHPPLQGEHRQQDSSCDGDHSS
jgi:hypothetical protein